MDVYLNTLASDLTDSAVVTPTATKKLYVRDITLDNRSVTTGALTLKFGSTIVAEAEAQSIVSAPEYKLGAVDQAITLTGKTGATVHFIHQSI